jgi:hypothetical protein
MMIWKEISLEGWAGKMRKELDKDFLKRKKYCPKRLAKAPDDDSWFNVSSATSDIAHVDPVEAKIRARCDS